MILEVINHGFQYEAEKLTRIFYPNEEIKVVREKTKKSGEAVIRTELSDNSVSVNFFDRDGKCLFSSDRKLGAGEDAELETAGLMFACLTDITGYVPAWGILTGIRPSKLLRSLKKTYGDAEGIKYFRKKYFVSEAKTELADSVAVAEEKIISLSADNSVSIYVSVPFCPTRCSYCSFVSHDMSAQTVKKLMPDYVEFLIKEARLTAEIVKELGLKTETVYIGGGTPTTLDAEQLKTLTSVLRESFDLTGLREFTAEAGRPDTVTAEKLRVLKAAGVDRISINPQSFSDSVLEAIGRKHTSQQTLEAFALAREIGFDNINTDLIAGLPSDSLHGFEESLEKAISLSAENITVHTLALKRASYLGEEGRVMLERAKMCSQMLDFAQSRLISENYHPYYMYRQSKSLNNLENTGYCKQGRECLYNIFMMEECHSVLALGAGGVTRLKAPHGDRIDRVFNFKYPYEYINNFDEIKQRKKQIINFYEDNR
ncbi:MAG: coproporphyrinogen dehydrogenase HemZ [Ruminococcaceae bacterium]|nr:coproporphyrinogen dehydrogenase HemZ [Oscillospiraceae bacterium]